jgi:glycerol-3-phosphate O-acyltransferase/dihydroxyacetone phosphate acyltransferase
LHLFFSTIRVHNSEGLPMSGPVLLVSNHHSGLVDPAVLIASLPRTPRFLAKAVLWDKRYLPLRPFLAAARAIPVHRRKDGGGDNDSMFVAAYEALGRGEAIAIFGEGVSHDMPGLLDLKTGASRIALGVDGVVEVVPVGLIYDDRARYRSHVVVYVGEPISVLGTARGDDDRDEVAALTARITEGLEEVAPSWDGWRQHDDARIAARLTVADRPHLQYGEVLTGLNRSIDAKSAIAADVCDAVELFEDEVDRLGIDLDVVVDEPEHGLGAIDRRSILESVVWWPVVTIGRVLNLVPFFGIRFAAHRQDLNFRATFKILFGLIVYPAWWVLLGVSIGWVTSPTYGFVSALSAPFIGYLSARVNGRLRHVKNRLTVEALRDIDQAGTSLLVLRRSMVVAATVRVLRDEDIDV